MKQKVQEITFVVEEAPEGGYTARGLEANIFTEADDLDMLRHEIVDAVRCHFSDEARPQLIRLHLVKDEILST